MRQCEKDYGQWLANHRAMVSSAEAEPVSSAEAEPVMSAEGGSRRTLNRRAFLGAAAGLGLAALVPGHRLAAIAATRPGPGQGGRFLTSQELATLRAVTARIVPGPPDDLDPGAVEAGAAEAIDLLLGAFTFDPPLIHAGGPFSGRFGGGPDDFAAFVPLDPLAELGWRIRIEGSGGRPDREFAGPVRGLQEIYREDLAHLDARAGGSFASLPGPAQDLILSDASDATVQELMGVAVAQTIDAVYGAPEYGGNRGLAGWTPINWQGDVQPQGYSDRQVSDPDPAPALVVGPGTADGLAPSLGPSTLQRFLPAVRGRAATPDRWWLGRPTANRG